jgi:hypothetical protein
VLVVWRVEPGRILALLALAGFVASLAPVSAALGQEDGGAATTSRYVAAMPRAANPDLPPLAVQTRMQNTAMPLACPEADDRCTGDGLVDALAAGTRR